ncbi:hypothetical protein ONS95_001786 [Cadophora gregata]|uniref:uncharacterized protein n=1 Tax=Cadophora gregata TaxID=51156 RepID=UPI0026DD39BD|nr:uncharacterized protein ONS95_001786 [Cadophora gregata]KAK0111426.1 hypothetical protein ONS95_001786 [Cadophora gregata]KAK0112095.1 hypothetical protein ONS96_001354 [Cadophora gregata f. sp. sojae]
MAPSYRNASRRQNRPGVDHGEYEGIPIRHWRRDFVTVAPPPTTDSTTSQSDIWAIELPYGMPKDSHLLPQHSQDLLRAARSGKIYKRPAPADEEEADPETVIGDKPEKKDEDLKEKGFTAKSWKQVPRHLEGADVVYLAKRRKGLVTASSKPLPVPTVTKATVKRIDAAGNEYVQDIVVPQGQVVEGEVLSQTQIPDPNAPVGLAPVQATPPRPRPKSKKKAKGPGRGRKKKPVAPTSAPQVPLAVGAAPLPTTEGTVGPDGIKLEKETSSTPVSNEDTEMGEGSAANSDDDDGEDGEDGDEGDDDEGSVDPQDSPSKPSQQSPSAASAPILPPITPLDQADVSMGGTEFPHVPPRLLTDRFEAKSGSPLKNVVMTTSTLTSPLEPPSASSPTKDLPEVHPLASEDTPLSAKMETLEEEMQQEVHRMAPDDIPLPPPEPTNVEVAAAIAERVEEEEEEEMLLDILDRAKNAEIGAPLDSPLVSASPAHRSPPVETDAAPSDPAPQVESEVHSTHATPQAVVISEPAQEGKAPSPEVKETPGEQEAVPIPPPAPISESVPVAESEAPLREPSTIDEDDDDNYPDLLGGLEKSLKTPEARVETPVAAPVSEISPEMEKAVVDASVGDGLAEVTEATEEEVKKDEQNTHDSEEGMLL